MPPPTDIIASLKPFFRLAQILGILPFGFQKPGNMYVLVESINHYRYARTLYAVIVAAEIILIPLYSYPNEIKIFLHLSSKVLVFLGYHIFLSSCLILFFIVSRNAKFLHIWINKVNVLCGCRLSPKKCRILKNLIWFLVTVASLNILVMLKVEVDGAIKLKSSWQQLVEHGAAFVVQVATNILLKLFILFVMIVKMYYENINETLAEWRYNRPESLLDSIRYLLREDNFVKDFIGALHSAYVPSITINFMWSFIFIVYIVLSIDKQDISPITQGTWIVYTIFEVFVVVYVCQVTKNQAEKTQHSLDLLLVDDIDPDLKEEIEIFSLQTQHRKVQFNANGFFDIDLTLLYSALGVIMTYIIILVQFQEKPVGSRECFCNETNIYNITI